MSVAELAATVREALGCLTYDHPWYRQRDIAFTALDALVAQAETAETLKADYDDVFGQLLRRHQDVHRAEVRVTQLEQVLRKVEAEARNAIRQGFLHQHEWVNVLNAVTADGVLAAGEMGISGTLVPPQGRPGWTPAPAASVPDNGLSAGEQPGAGITTSQPEGVGRILPDEGGPSMHPSAAPAERPYRTDWKKRGKK